MLKKALLFFISVFLFCGCSSKKNYEEIVFSSWGSITEVQILKELINKFETENPKIKINFIHIPQNYFQKIHLLFASNTAPDVLFINNLNLPIYESKLEEISNLDNVKDFYPQALSGMSYNGKLKGVPRDISNLVLYLNLDKISMPSKNWTLEDLLEISRNSTKDNTFGISYEPQIYWALPYLTYYGGGILDKSFNVIIESESSQKGLNFYKDLVYKYEVAPSPSQVGSSTLAQMFIEGRLSMYLSGRWMYPKICEIANFNWAIINFPYGNNSQLCDVSGWAISKNSKHKDSAIKFVNFLASEEASKYFVKTGLIVPARKSASVLLNNPEHNEKVFLEVINNSSNTPVSKYYNKLVDKVNSKFY